MKDRLRESSLVLVLFLILAQGLAAVGAGRTVPARPRLIVLTDIGGDPDDQQSMVRLMTFANEFVIEGLIASASGTPGELKMDIVKPELIRQIVEAYGQVRGNLAQHAEGYPEAGELLAKVKSGNPHRGVENLGEGKDTEGSNWIIKVVDSPDPRPVCIAIWGGETELAQALWRVRHDRKPEQVKAFLAKLRVYDIAQQDDTGPWILENFPGLFYILAKAPEGKAKTLGAFRGMYLDGDMTLTSGDWINGNVRTGHGPLGALYPPKTSTRPNPYGALKEGDTPSWFYFLPNGLSDPEHPEWGCWGGRFRHEAGGLYRDAQDKVGGTQDARATVWRWREAFQNVFQARMDWCVKGVKEANHAPLAAIDGYTGRTIAQRTVIAGERITLSAKGSSDPDGNKLAYRWWVYPEAGSYAGEVRIENAGREEATVSMPAEAHGKEIHIILEVTDDGSPRLTSYRRVVLHPGVQ